MAGRIRVLIARQDVPWRLTVSIGVATTDSARADEPLDAPTLIRVADAALYEAKRRGRNTVVVQHPERTPPAPERHVAPARHHGSRGAS
jgi:PleD family two-component response regulator